MRQPRTRYRPLIAVGRRGRPSSCLRPLSSFVGRERELDELEGLIANARLVTLTGPGGSGKTRLAIETARRTADRLATDIAFVDLAPISDPGLIVSTIATALRDPARGRTNSQGGARRSLRCASHDHRPGQSRAAAARRGDDRRCASDDMSGPSRAGNQPGAVACQW